MFCSPDTYRKTWNIKEELKIQSLYKKSPILDLFKEDPKNKI